MRWKGSIIGGSIGFLISANPYGTVLGAISGYIFQNHVSPGLTLSPKRKKILSNWSFLISGLCKINKLPPAKLLIQNQHIFSYFSISAKELEFIKIQCKKFYSSLTPQKLSSFLKTLDSALSQPMEKEKTMALLLLLHQNLPPNKNRYLYLQKISKWLHFSDEQFEKLIQKYTLQNLAYYKVLQVSIFDSYEKIKNKYYSMIKKYHPDAILESKEGQKKEDKAQKINRAWNTIKKYHQI